MFFSMKSVKGQLNEIQQNLQSALEFVAVFHEQNKANMLGALGQSEYGRKAAYSKAKGHFDAAVSSANKAIEQMKSCSCAKSIEPIRIDVEDKLRDFVNDPNYTGSGCIFTGVYLFQSELEAIQEYANSVR